MHIKILISFYLIIAAIYDYKLRIIPPVIPLAIFLTSILTPGFYPLSAIINGLATGLLLYIPCLLRPGAFGGGDMKLIAACGFYAGFYTCLIALIVALIISLIFARLTIKHRACKLLPLAPFWLVSFTPILFTR